MSTFDAQNIESTSGGAPNFSQGLNVGGSSITSLITMTEYYSQAGEPSSPANGAVWWDGSVAYQYVGGAWRILSVTPPPANSGNVGTFATFNMQIDTFAIDTLATATAFGNLTVNRQQMAGCSNGSRGLYGGGYTGSYSNVIDYITFATTGNATDFGDLTVARAQLAAASNGPRGVFAGGYTGLYEDTMDYVAIATAGNAVDFGNLTSFRADPAGLSDRTYGVFAGGTISGGSRVNTIDYVTIATTGNAVDFGDLTITMDQMGSCEAGGRGVFAGGVGTNVIQYITVATPGNAIDFGDLTGTFNFGSAAVANDTRGVISVNATYNYITIATPGNAAIFSTGNYNNGYYPAGCSGN